MAYDRKRKRRGGGAGSVVMALLVLALLGGVVAVIAWKFKQLDAKPPAATGPKAWLERTLPVHGIVGQLPETLPEKCLLKLNQLSRQVDGRLAWIAPAGSTDPSERYPIAWVDLQFEGRRFTALAITAYNRPEGLSGAAACVDLVKNPELAGESEGAALLAFVAELAAMPEGSAIERQTPGWRFFGWKHQLASSPQRSLVCFARRDGAPEAEALYARKRADWDARPGKSAPAPAPAPAAP